ncbi:hypothetical protein E2C01_083129 [Portunus trituberculatus]|uniref:Uncharacterized protein n=1 Tax=Portunus trituberculatus TaxID=210409 RepID=A0A5B7IU37_PORTR|nr:hypothetical protein [Portunus trituberculatus]
MAERHAPQFLERRQDQNIEAPRNARQNPKETFIRSLKREKYTEELKMAETRPTIHRSVTRKQDRDTETLSPGKQQRRRNKARVAAQGCLTSTTQSTLQLRSRQTRDAVTRRKCKRVPSTKALQGNTADTHHYTP